VRIVIVTSNIKVINIFFPFHPKGNGSLFGKMAKWIFVFKLFINIKYIKKFGGKMPFCQTSQGKNVFLNFIKK